MTQFVILCFYFIFSLRTEDLCQPYYYINRKEAYKSITICYLHSRSYVYMWDPILLPHFWVKQSATEEAEKKLSFQ